jgi:hypothetical protein
MSDAPVTIVCAHCQTSNLRAARYCVQCGHLLGEPASSAAEPEPNESPEVAADATLERIRAIVLRSGHECTQTRVGYRLRVKLDGNRGQTVHVLFGGKDDSGDDLISFLSVCGAADERNARVLLKRNSRMLHGHFAIRTMNGQEYFVVQANQLAESADELKVKNTLAYLAQQADHIEAQLSKGRDLY